MKENKSFVIYSDWENTFNKIGKYEAGDLIQGIFKYMRTGETPEFESFAVEAVFSLLVETFKRDREKYLKICEKNAVNARKGGRPTNDSKTQKTQWVFDKPKKTDNDNDNDNENDNENENDNDNENEINISTSSSSEMRGDDVFCEASVNSSRSNTHTYTADFLTFWLAYPKKVGKGAAYKSYKKLNLSKKEKADILAALSWQKKSQQWLRDNGQYIPYPATYLNQRRWEDEPQQIFGGDIASPDKYINDDEDDFDFNIN